MKTRLSVKEVQEYFPSFIESDLHQAVADQGRVHHFNEGDVILDYGGYVRMVPVILSGTIKISRMGNDGSELFLYYLTRGESCTMTFSCCISDKKSEIRAVAEEATTVLALPQQRLDEWMMRFKSWKNFVMRAYDQRMQELIQTIDQVAFNQLDVRLADYVRRRAEVRGDRTIQTTHQQIADDLHVSREAVSRLLKVLEHRGMIELGRNQIRVLSTGITG